MAEPIIEIDTATTSTLVGRTVHIRVGGVVFEARCPKDAILVQIQESEEATLPSIVSFMSAMVGTKSGAEIRDMLTDPDNAEVSISSLHGVIRFLMSDPAGPRWDDALTASIKALGSGEMPRTIPVKAPSVARKATARKTAAPRKAVARKAVARKAR